MSKQTRDWFRFVTNRTDDKPPEIHIYGDIGETFFDDAGVSAQSFVDQLADVDAPELHVRINSPGGSAWDGMTIANAIIRHPAKVTTHIDGIAASAASIVAFAGDEVVSSKYGRGMMHNARAIVMGTSDDMREVATQIDALNATIASYYADRSTGGQDAAWFARAMAKETWYNADEMLAAGLVTRVDASGVRDEVERAVASALATTRMRYEHPPAATTKETRMATKDELAKRLGKDPADVTDEDLFEAALAALGEPAVDDKPADPPAAPVVDEKPIVDAPAEPALAGAAAKDGTVTVDRDAFASLQAQAALGAKAYADAQAKANDDAVEKAISEGRITPARKNHYLALMSSDRVDTLDLLTKRLEPGAAVPLTEVGHAADVADATASITDDPRFKSFTKGLI